jgi:DivIVA domain-containing protein
VSTGFEKSGEEGTAEGRPTFGSVRRGYDPKEVDAFLNQVASNMRILEARSRQAAGEASGDGADLLPERFAKLLAVQEREVETLLTDAHMEAATMVAEAKREADRIRSVGRVVAERSVVEARALLERAAEEVDRLRSDLAERRQQFIQRFPEIQHSVLTFLQDVEVMLDSIGDRSRFKGPANEEPVDEEPSAT